MKPGSSNEDDGPRVASTPLRMLAAGSPTGHRQPAPEAGADELLGAHELFSEARRRGAGSMSLASAQCEMIQVLGVEVGLRARPRPR